MISVSNLAMGYGDRTLFAGAAFQLNAGDRYGLVGANGSGKTTLLNILSGELEPTDGQVSVPKSARLGVLRQDQFLYEEQRILDVALMGNRELWAAMSEKAELLARAADGDFDAHRFSELEDVVQRHHGYAAEARAASILEGLGLPAKVHDDPLSTLSGGFKLRVLLAQVLAAAPDVLLLDEPTNHLDILSIRWLEKFLQDFAGPVVVISHDHRFLDNVATKILDVDYETILLYDGTYSEFVVAKREERERREKEIATREKEIAHHQDFVDRFRAKASKARQAQSKLRLIEKRAGELTELPGSSRKYPKFRFSQARPSGREVLTVTGIRRSFGDNEVLHGVDLSVRRGDRLAIIGPNGIGKSTLLKIVVGDLAPDAGTVEWGYETHPGYFAQDQHEQLDASSQTAESWLWGFCPGKDRGFVRGQMGLMLFTDDDGEKPLAALSGGEAARLVFSRLMLERPNVLVLDEPTNHLDLESIEALVEGLKAYDGTLILVSHDRWFVGRLATRILEIEPEGVTDYPGTYDAYVHAAGDDHLDADTVVRRSREKAKDRHAKKKAAGANGGTAVGEGQGGGRRVEGGRENGGGDGARPARRRHDPERLRRLERRADELIEAVGAAEARVADIDARFAEPGFFDHTAPDEIADLDRERKTVQEDVGRLTAEWEEVENELRARG
jgi:ATPase subunit of ABC transporter with duplicated ATPase domains